ncbi:MAG: PBP1A family penicillin-binding protein [Deltaproteobacteria bacterium]|nr:PBP1A family penicillin-binding protein [Deltaproteobacteria bacterium]
MSRPSQISPAADHDAPPPPPRRRRKSIWARLFIWSLVVVFLMAAAGAGAVAGAWFWISRDLPSVDSLKNYQPPIVTKVLSADGRLMAEFHRERRYIVDVKTLPRHVLMAFVAAEDGDFFRHQGVDVFGVLRAAWANFKAGRVVQGGSTITQQVAKGLLLSPERSMIRKIKEAILAIRMEEHLSKEDILGLYLNQVYLGHGAYGVEAAAQTYFGKSAHELDVAESSLLAGLVQAPSRYSPLRYPRRARTRQVYVIGRMLEDGDITKQEAEAAQNENLDVNLVRPAQVDTPYYTEAVRQWLEEKYGDTLLYEGGLTVYTACDPTLTNEGQEAIQRGLDALTRRQGYKGPLGRLDPADLRDLAARPAPQATSLKPGQEVTAVVTKLEDQHRLAELRLGLELGYIPLEQVTWAHPFHRYQEINRLEQVFTPGDRVRVRLVKYQPAKHAWDVELEPPPVAQAALVAMEPATGRVRALIGGRDFNESQYNRAFQARRQPGSSFKPFIYAAALDWPQGSFTPSSIILDAPVVYDDPGQPGEKWKPKNYENRFYGPTTFRQALEHSRNVVTVKILAQIGLDYTINYARRFGFESELAPNLSLALGTSGVSLLDLTRAYGVFADGGVLREPVLVERVLDRRGQVIYEAQPKSQEAISPQTAYLMIHLLKGVMQNGTGQGVNLPDRVVAGKTGTTNDLRDAWFMGFSPRLVTGVWVGQDDNLPLGHRETGARAAGPIWKDFMSHALAGEQPQDFPVPEGVVFARVDPASGRLLPPGDAGGFFEAFKAGTENTVQSAGAASSPPAEPVDFMQREAFVN